jgi:hypothetical protein
MAIDKKIIDELLKDYQRYFKAKENRSYGN